jgi:hypothetical protein
MFSSILILAVSIGAFAQTTEFTYQGSLNVGSPPGSPATTPHDFEFRLFAAQTGGSALATLQRLNVPVTNGTFSVKLDFGSQFPGANRFIEVAVKPVGGGSFTTLTPRQLVNSAPYAIHSLNAAAVGGLPPSGFIQNTTSTQPSSNFNVSGNGNIGGTLRVEGVAGGTAGSFSSSGRFDIDAPFIPGGRFTILENGSVGIGAATPTSRFHINVPSSTDPISALSVDVQSFSTPGNALASHYFRVRDIGSGSPSAFYVRGDGKIGVGTESPSHKLHVVDAASSLRFGTEKSISFLRIGNSVTDGASVVSVSNDETDWQMRVDGPSFVPGNFQNVFSIWNDTTQQLGISVCCAALPRVGIGMGNPVVTFEVRPGGGALADSWSVRSSARIKRNIQTISVPLEILRRLRGVSFDYLESGRHSIGFVAEEVVGVLPEAVERNPENGEVIGVDYSRLVPVAIEAVKEQQAQIEALSKTVERQQAQIEALKKLVCALNSAAEGCSDPR